MVPPPDDAPPPVNIELTDAPPPETRDAILAPLLEFNAAQAGPSNARPLAILLRRPGSDAVVGGLLGRTAGGMLFVELFFIPEDLRRGGLGRRLLAQAEEEARRRGCHGAWLDTYSFQARGFYEKQGYTVFGEIRDYPPGHSRYFLSKRFAPAGASAG
ncbi:GNAT family N-acetyltransferase [Roseomonas elaeocarpi]|uniref:GNAT family N-acetyltransferase n=1 Tax=Roseomonas elaeocarpi TaxID=907779 RepID=A0ABV6JWC4_9PROT